MSVNTGESWQYTPIDATPISSSRQNTRRTGRDFGSSNFLFDLKEKTESKIVDWGQESSLLLKEFLDYDNFLYDVPVHKLTVALEFFREAAKKLPILKQICTIVFSVTASSVPSEALFSWAGLVQDE